MNRYRFDDSMDERGKQKHIHLLDEKPLIGTTTALKVLAKPLTWWASGLAVAELGWIKPLDTRKSSPVEVVINKDARLASARIWKEDIGKMSAEAYLALLDKAYRAHDTKLDKSATTGTDMHADLEQYGKYCIENNDGRPVDAFLGSPVVKIFRDWSVANVKRFIAAEGHGYSESLWVGCIFDVLYEDMQGRLVILDHKSSKEAYLSQFFQCAGNDIQIMENGVLDRDGNLLYKVEKPIDYYAVFPFGMEKPEPQFHYDTERAKEGFRAAVTLHKIINN